MSKKIKSRRGGSKTKQGHKGSDFDCWLRMKQEDNLFHPNISKYVSTFQSNIDFVEMPLNRSMRRHINKINKDI